MAILLAPNRSAIATTAASTVPRARSAYVSTSSAARSRSALANMFDGELSRDEASKELGFHARPGSCREQIGHLRDHEVRNDERLADLFEPGDALAMVWIIAKSGRYQRSSVDDDDTVQTNPSASSLSSACLAEKPGLA